MFKGNTYFEKFEFEGIYFDFPYLFFIIKSEN